MQSQDKEGFIVAVVTTINQPNDAMDLLLDFATAAKSKVVIVGDTKTPESWTDTDFEFLNIDTQRRLFPELCDIVPMRHYSRKNLGYLHAQTFAPDWLYETDDDNIPTSSPFASRDLQVEAMSYSSQTKWLNIYQVFGVDDSSLKPQQLWPRGFDLKSVGMPFEREASKLVSSPLQQGLANGDPDVDAIYRLTVGNLVTFNDSGPVVLNEFQVCPVNSQTTWWHKSIFQLMYLPSTCTFRLTDIIRGFVAWRILLSTEGAITFHSPKVKQERNFHDLLRDFEDEMELFLGSDAIVETLLNLDLTSLTKGQALLSCYESLVKFGVIKPEEIQILQAWNANF
jgi:hypothetical protein